MEYGIEKRQSANNQISIQLSTFNFIVFMEIYVHAISIFLYFPGLIMGEDSKRYHRYFCCTENMLILRYYLPFIGNPILTRCPDFSLSRFNNPAMNPELVICALLRPIHITETTQKERGLLWLPVSGLSSPL